MIHRTPFLLPWLYPSLWWRVATGKKEVYLTFDDGPVPGPTEFVLDTLGAHQAKATFFCIGDNVRKHPAVYQRILREGHATGNHTFHHVNGWKTGAAHYMDEITRCAHEMALHGAATTLFRPPYGRITRRQIKQLQAYKIVMWDVLSADYDRHLAPERCFRNTMRAIRPGSIVVFHDSVKAEPNLKFALPRVLQQLEGEGYVFKSLAG